MKIINKIALLGCIPVLALTSCGSKKVTFEEASDYCVNHYDANAFDNIDALYSVKLNNLDFNLDVTVKSAASTFEFPFAFSLGGVTFQAEAPVICLNSSVLGIIQGLCARYLAITAKSISDIGVESKYLINGGCLEFAVESTAENKITNLVASAFAVINAYYIFSHKTKDTADNVPSSKSTLLDSFTEAFASSNGSSGAKGIIEEIGALGIGMMPDSTGKGTFGLGLKTTNKGYINDVYLRAGAEVDFHLASNVFPTEDEESEEEVFDIPEYNYHVKGSVNFDFEICNDVK